MARLVYTDKVYPAELRSNQMPFVSLTRLRIRSIRFLPLFILDMLATLRQVKKAPGFQYGALLADRQWTFWTMTAWDTQDSMRHFMTTDAHKEAMPHLLNWCDEASVAHWAQPEDPLPTWQQADQRMRATGRPSKVRHPSPQHATLSYHVPASARGATIRPSR